MHLYGEQMHRYPNRKERLQFNCGAQILRAEASGQTATAAAASSSSPQIVAASTYRHVPYPSSAMNPHLPCLFAGTRPPEKGWAAASVSIHVLASAGWQVLRLRLPAPCRLQAAQCAAGHAARLVPRDVE